MFKNIKGKYLIVWSMVSIFWLLSIFSASTTFGQNKLNANDSKYYYFQDKVFGKNFSFKPRKDEIFISFTSESTPAMMKRIVKDEKLTSIYFSEKKRFGVYKLNASAISSEKAITKLRGIHGVESAIPVMEDQEGIKRHFIPHKFTVQFEEGVSRSRIQKIVNAHGCRIIKEQRTPGYYTLAVSKGKMDREIIYGNHGKALFETIREFNALDDVKFAEPSYVVINSLQDPFYPNDLEFPSQWNLNDTGQIDPNTDCDISAPEAWEIERGKQNVVVVVIDTGIDMNHDDLVEKLLPREGEDWDFSDGPSKIPHDVEGHGTCVAGIAAANTNNSYGVAGIAHGCKIMPLKVEFGYGNAQDYVDALNYVAEYGDKHSQYRYVVNCSWTSGGDSTGIHNAIINLKSSNIFICFASGNYNPFNPFDTTDVTYPARYNEVLAVGASSPCNEHKDLMSCDGELWTSKYGPELDAVAPGVFVPSTDITGIGGYNDEGDYFASFGGTSAACPHVAGLAALLISKYPNMDVSGIEVTIKLNAKDIEAPGWDEETGFGLIDAFQSLSNPGQFIEFDLVPDISSNHPYQNDANIVWEISRQGATAMRIHFSDLRTESGYDFVYLTDGNGNSYGPAFDGDWGSFTSYVIPGDTVLVRLVTDSSVTDYGFDIDYCEYLTKNVYVDCNAIGANNGTSWQDAYATIQMAIDDPNTINGSTIWVAEGIYQEQIDFKGKSIALLSITDPNKTIIDGNGSGPVVRFAAGENNAILYGFTITGGGLNQYGGGIYCSSSSPTITNCIITGNSSNPYNGYGGGIYCYSSSPTITKCAISDNSARYGAGFSCRYCPSPAIKNCIITENSSTAYGGGSYLYNSSPTIIDCTISGNSTDYHGGGFYFASSSTIPNIVGCVISGNSASYYGGGIYSNNSTPNLTNCVITGNTAYMGGGIRSYYSSPIIMNCTFSKNLANYDGGGIYGTFSSPTITNCIFWNDIPDEFYGATPIVTYSDIKQNYGVYPGTGNINADPLFIDPNGDYHLQEGSPCKDTADPNAPGLPSTDIDGNPRDPNYPDMGAYELMTFHVYPGQSIQQAIDNAVDGSVVIVHTGQYFENINFRDRALTLRSTDPDDPAVVGSTIIDGGNAGCVVVFNGDNGNNDEREGHKSVLSGFTLQNGTGFLLAPNTLGGAIYCDEASPSITKCRIIDSAADFGGGIFCFGASPCISNCEIIDNHANISGGGIYSYICSPHIINCIIASNDALNGGGGGIMCEQAPAYIVNCTLYGNTRHNNFNGSGIFNLANFNLECPTIVNCILWNDQPNWDEISNSNPAFPAIVDFSDVEMAGGVYPGQGNINANPQFVNVLNNDFHLQNGSPCINAGTNAETVYDYKVFYLDRDGYPRPVGEAYDIGAYEFIGAIRYVPDEYSTIQGAIGSANNWDVIIVAPGIYKENIDFTGKAITLMSMDPWDPEVVENTIIDGNQVDSVVKFEQSEGANSVLSGFTVQNGSAVAGGGIYSYSSSPTITNCIIDKNSAYGDHVYSGGGGIYCRSSSPNIFNCEITNNSAAIYRGGGIVCSFISSPIISNCTFYGNSANEGGGLYIHGSSSTPSLTNCYIIENSASSKGGGIYFHYYASAIITNCTISRNSSNSYGGGIYSYYYTTSSITNCTISENWAENYGGGIEFDYYTSPNLTDCSITGNSTNYSGAGVCCHFSSPSLTNCIISENSAKGSDGYGGGMSCYNAHPTLTDCSINNNSATRNGGGFYLYSYSTATITNCIISGNHASYYGGGFSCYYSPPDITNSIISGNHASIRGGGIYSGNSSTSILNSTISQNTASGHGALYFYGNSSSTILNGIVWDNTPYHIGVIYNATLSIDYSDIQHSGIYPGTGNINADPLFVNPNGEDFHLQFGSPCIDSGTNNGAPATDKDGVTRPQDGDGNGSAICDMGAYEFL